LGGGVHSVPGVVGEGGDVENSWHRWRLWFSFFRSP
jgi:hypothetical protein